MKTNHIYGGSALDVLRTMPAVSIQCVVTSPPYFGLRDYGVDGQIGLEETPHEFVAALVAIFAEVHRVLRDDGVLWVNLGDTYASGEVGRHDSVQGRQIDGRIVTTKARSRQQQRTNTGLPAKSRLFIPHRFAIAMQDAGWIARDEIVWHKSAPMPESVKDRTTRAHEFIFMFTKQQRYYYDAAAVAEPAKRAGEGLTWQQRKNAGEGMRRDYSQNGINRTLATGDTRNLRSVWTLSPDPFPGAHFATFPREIPKRCILAATKPGDVVLDPFMGAGTTAVVARQLGRQYVGIELNPEYVKIAEDRLADPCNAQIDLFASQGVAA